MAHYKAEVWLGSNSGFQTVDIHSSSINGVTEQIVRIYGVKPENVRNIRLANDYNITEEANGNILLFAILLLFIFFPAYTLSVLFGGAGAWIVTKISRKTFEEIDSNYKNLYVILIIVSVLFGGVGFYIGHHIQQQTNQVQEK